MNSENVYWIDYRKDRQFIGSEFRNGRFKIDSFVHARLRSEVDLRVRGIRVCCNPTQTPAHQILCAHIGLFSCGRWAFFLPHLPCSEVSSVGLVWEGRDKKKGNMRVSMAQARLFCSFCLFLVCTAISSLAPLAAGQTTPTTSRFLSLCMSVGAVLLPVWVLPKRGRWLSRHPRTPLLRPIGLQTG